MKPADNLFDKHRSTVIAISAIPMAMMASVMAKAG